jgi:hypothetical protein
MNAYATAPQGNGITWAKLANALLHTGWDGDSVNGAHGGVICAGYNVVMQADITPPPPVPS